MSVSSINPLQPSKKVSPGYILYIDHQNHPAPITECFIATASRRLSSSIDRIHRPSTITQVDSSYCPQCLVYYDITKGRKLGYCTSVKCKRCPLCFNVLSLIPTESGKYYYYQCGSELCGYNTKETLFGKSIDEISDKLSKLKIEHSIPMMKQQEELYNNTIYNWEKAIINHKSDSKNQLTKKLSTVASLRKGGGVGVGGGGGANLEDVWSIASLETSLNEKKKKAQFENSSLKRIGLENNKGNTGESSSSTGLDKSLDNQSVLSLILSATDIDNTPTTTVTPRSMKDMYPLSIPLRARKSRRCRAELADGKPGILLKPKLNPLEGDTSLRTGHGQWYKKDSSAIHVVPRVSIVYHRRVAVEENSGDCHHIFLCKVNNPTLGMINLRFKPSSTYIGEASWETDDKLESLFENLLIDSKTDTKVNVQLNTTTGTSSTTTSTSSPTIELNSDEDAFVDLAKSRQLPPEVIQWKKKQQQEEKEEGDKNSSTSNGKQMQINLISPKEENGKYSCNGTAWFELIVPNNEIVTTTATAVDENNKYKNSPKSLWQAVSIAMQIQVGNGSWESSLIKSKPPLPDTTPDNIDWVTFDLLVTWPPNNKTNQQ